MGSIVSEFHCDLHFLSLGGCKKPTKTCVFSAFLEAFGSGGFWPGSVLIYNRFFLNRGFFQNPTPQPPSQGPGVRIAWCFQLVQHLRQLSDFHCVFNLSSICDRPGICGSFDESELHGVSMFGALGGQVWVRIPMVYSMFLCLWGFAWRPCGVFGWLGMFVPVLAALVNQNCMVFPCLVN